MTLRKILTLMKKFFESMVVQDLVLESFVEKDAEGEVGRNLV